MVIRYLLFTALLCLVFSTPLIADESTGSQPAQDLARDAQDIVEGVREAALPGTTTVLREVYNMPAGSGEALLQSGRVRATFVSSDDEGLTQQVRCAQQSAEESEIPGPDADDGDDDDDEDTGNAPGTGAWLDIELRLHAINGFNPLGGGRVPYSEAGFNSSANLFVAGAHDAIAGMNFREAFEHLNGIRGDDINAQDLMDSLLRDRIINSSGADRIAVMRDAGSSMAFDDQIRFIAKLGGNMQDNYDHDRADQSVSADGSVSCDTILNGLSGSDPAGVCRDIVMCQATVLHHMGNTDNVYAASFPTPGNYHVTLMVTDPNNRNRVHKINYDNIAVEDTLMGSAGIDQSNSSDVGTLVRVWRAREDDDGQIVGTFAGAIPTEIGLLLEEQTSPNPGDTTGGGRYDPFTRRTYTVMNAGGGYGPVGGRVFASQLANGDVVFGVGAHASWGSPAEGSQDGVYQGIDNQGHVGLAYAHRTNDRLQLNNDGPIETNTMTTNMIYLSVHQHVGVPLRINENWTITPYADLHLEAVAIEGGYADDRGEWTGDGNIATNVGGAIQYSDGRTTVRAHAHTQLTLGVNDIRDFSTDIGVYTNYTQIGLDVSTMATPELMVQSSILCSLREFQDTCMVSAGGTYFGDSVTHSFNVGLLTPVSEQQQPWAPGGSRTSLTANYGAVIPVGEGSAFRAGVGYTQSLEDNNFMVNGTLGFSWR